MRLTLCAAALLVVTATSAHASPADLIARQRAEIRAVHQRLVEKRAQLDFEVVRERDYRRQLSETGNSIAVVQARLGDLQRRIEAGSAQEEEERRRLSDAVAALQTHRSAYRRRLVEMYEHPEGSYWTVLVGATSFTDFVERWRDLGYVVVGDQREVHTRDAAVRRVDAADRAVEASVVRLQEQHAEQTQTQRQLGALAQERENLVAMAERHRASVAGEVQQLEDISAQEEAQLEAFVRAQEAELARERAQRRIAELPAPREGAMLWPVSGPITSPFGMRLNPFGGGNTEFHPGIDIAVAVGTNVVAAASGRVIIAGWVSGYGEYVAVDHGGGITTGYGHLSRILVSVGQDVQRGQVIAVSGNTGRSTGPHLIFEVRRNGTPVDPNPYL